MKAIQVVHIKSLIPLYKGKYIAEKVELATFVENGFEVVVRKNIYNTGDVAVYIQPDFCLPDGDIFNEFIRPDGDEKKSYLGKVEGVPRRIRAKKFTLSKT